MYLQPMRSSLGPISLSLGGHHSRNRSKIGYCKILFLQSNRDVFLINTLKAAATRVPFGANTEDERPFPKNMPPIPQEMNDAVREFLRQPQTLKKLVPVFNTRDDFLEALRRNRLPIEEQIRGMTFHSSEDVIQVGDLLVAAASKMPPENPNKQKWFRYLLNFVQEPVGDLAMKVLFPTLSPKARRHELKHILEQATDPEEAETLALVYKHLDVIPEMAERLKIIEETARRFVEPTYLIEAPGEYLKKIKPLPLTEPEKAQLLSYLVDSAILSEINTYIQEGLWMEAHDEMKHKQPTGYEHFNDLRRIKGIRNNNRDTLVALYARISHTEKRQQAIATFEQSSVKPGIKKAVLKQVKVSPSTRYGTPDQWNEADIAAIRKKLKTHDISRH